MSDQRNLQIQNARAIIDGAEKQLERAKAEYQETMVRMQRHIGKMIYEVRQELDIAANDASVICHNMSLQHYMLCEDGRETCAEGMRVLEALCRYAATGRSSP